MRQFVNDINRPTPPSPPQSTPRQLRFSLKALLLVMTAVAVALAFGAMSPSLFRLLWNAVWLTLGPALMAFIASVALYARGKYRTFAVGALVGAVSWFLLAGLGTRAPMALTSVGWWPVSALVGGYVAVATRRWIEGRQWDQDD